MEAPVSSLPVVLGTVLAGSLALSVLADDWGYPRLSDLCTKAFLGALAGLMLLWAGRWL